MRRAALPLLLAVTLTSAAAPGHAADFHVDAARSTVVVRVWKEGAASIFAHDHVARATKITGSIRYDPARPSESTVEMVVDAGGLVMDEPNTRRRFELPPIADVSRREIQNTMRSPGQLDVATYPTITFRSRRVDEAGPGKLRVTGTFTLHGQAHEITLPAEVDLRGNFLHATGSVRFPQSAYGITPYSFGSAVRNQDEVEMVVELVAAP